MKAGRGKRTAGPAAAAVLAAFVLVTSSVSGPAAGAPQRVTVEEAWALAETNHPRVVDGMRRLDAAVRDVAQREAAYGPTLSASVGGLTYRIGPDGETSTPSLRPSLTASWKLPAGMTLTGSLSTASPSGRSGDDGQRLQGSVSLNYSLFRSPDLDGDALALDQARFSLALAERELEQLRDEARADVFAALHGDEIAAIRLALAEEAFAEAERAWGDARSRVELGIVPETELLTARIDFLRAEQELLNARRSRQSRRRQLLDMLGLTDGDGEYVFESVLDWTGMPEPPPLDEAVARALAADGPLQERKEAARIAELQLEEERRKPRFDSRLSVGFATGSTSEAERNAGWTVGVDFSLPILDGGQRQRALHAREEAYERALEAVADAERAVVRQVEDAYVQLEDARRDEEIARLELTRARLELERLQRQANLPVAMAGEQALRQAERALLRAELSWRESVQRYQARWIALQTMLGPVDWTRLLGDNVDRSGRSLASATFGDGGDLP